MLWAIVPALASALAPSSASARDWPNTAGWTIVETDDSCGMSMTFEGKGSTKLLMILGLDGGAIINVSNASWSAKADEKYEGFSWAFGDAVYSGNVRGTHLSGEDPGFVGYFDGSVVSAAANASKLVILRGDQIVDDLSLRGSGAAVAMMRRCIADLAPRHAAAEREKHRFDHITDDPFKPPVETQTATSTSSRIAPFFGADAYPASAIRAGEQGRVTFRATIGADGRAQDCLIVTSSGFTDLDAATCRVVKVRVRLPSSEPGGAAGPKSIEAWVDWKLPAS